MSAVPPLNFKPNIPPSANNLPDDCDRASSIVGVDINKYVFGDDFVPNTTGEPSRETSSKTVKNAQMAGFAGFLGLLGTSALILYKKFKH